jgi:nucleoside phosphorylase/predicted nucleotidyltransferase
VDARSPEEKRLANLPDRASPIRASAKQDLFNVHQDLPLREAVEELAARLPKVADVRLFGSRRHRSGSARSDIDLLVVGDQLPPASNVAAIAREIDSYLDVFVARGGVAHSVVNESVIEEGDFDRLVGRLDALPLWNRNQGWLAGSDFENVRVLAGFNPPYTLAAVVGPEPLVTRTDILFVSALAKEHAAIVSEFDRSLATPPGPAANYQLGEIDAGDGPRRVAACVADRAGPIAAALTTYRGVEFFRPHLIVLVGITAGIEDRVKLGDLIIPDTVVEYEATKVGLENEQPNGRQHAIAPRLIEAVQAWSQGEQRLAEISASDLRPAPGTSALSTDPIASGNKVIASAERAEMIAGLSRKTSAIEMEALGVVEAGLRSDPQVPVMVVKTVSDLADEDKDDSWHAYAAFAAASLSAALVRDRVI